MCLFFKLAERSEKRENMTSSSHRKLLVVAMVVVSVVVGTFALKIKKKNQKSNIHLTNLGTINYRQKFMDV
jgi:hypothetical protein